MRKLIDAAKQNFRNKRLKTCVHLFFSGFIILVMCLFYWLLNDTNRNGLNDIEFQVSGIAHTDENATELRITLDPKQRINYSFKFAFIPYILHNSPAGQACSTLYFNIDQKKEFTSHYYNITFPRREYVMQYESRDVESSIVLKIAYESEFQQKYRWYYNFIGPIILKKWFPGLPVPRMEYYYFQIHLDSFGQKIRQSQIDKSTYDQLSRFVLFNAIRDQDF